MCPLLEKHGTHVIWGLAVGRGINKTCPVNKALVFGLSPWLRVSWPLDHQWEGLLAGVRFLKEWEWMGGAQLLRRLG